MKNQDDSSRTEAALSTPPKQAREPSETTLTPSTPIASSPKSTPVTRKLSWKPLEVTPPNPLIETAPGTRSSRGSIAERLALFQQSPKADAPSKDVRRQSESGRISDMQKKWALSDLPPPTQTERKVGRLGDDFKGLKIPLTPKLSVLRQRKEPCYICLELAPGEEQGELLSLACGHFLCLDHGQGILRTLPQPGSFFAIYAGRCGTCKSWIQHATLETPYFASIRKLAMDLQILLVKTDAINISAKDKEIVLRQSSPIILPFMDKAHFIICYLCKELYWAGGECKEASVEDTAEDRKDRVCPTCQRKQLEALTSATLSFPPKCETHGDGFIQWKCRYCCKTAIWFCAGTTHFCERCHRTAWSSAVQPCDCPPPALHAPNGQEQCLGCYLCRLGGGKLE